MTLVLVEGASDRVALETLAARLGRDLVAEGVEVRELGGATNVAKVLAEQLGARQGLRLAGLYDAPEERFFVRGTRARRDWARSRTAGDSSSSASSPACATSRTS